MIVEGYQFTHVADLAPLRTADASPQAFMPQGRYDNRRELPLNRFGAGPFCKFTIPNIYRKPGVYLLVAGADIRYVGECANLSERFNAGYGNISPRNCFRGGQETNCRLNSLVYQAAFSGEKLTLHFHGTPDYKAVEVKLRLALRAPWNRV